MIVFFIKFVAILLCIFLSVEVVENAHNYMSVSYPN